MSSTDRGRHKAGRHAAPKKPRNLNKHAGAVFGLASVGTAAITGASSVAHPTTAKPVTLADPVEINPKSPTSTIYQAASARAQAASRSENRTSLTDTQNINAASSEANPADDPNAVIDTTPTVDTAQRRALAAVAPTSDGLAVVVDEAQQQADDQAQQLVNQQKAQEAAAAKAAADAQAMARAAEEARLIGVKEAPIHGTYHLTARFGQRGSLWSKGWHTGLDFQVPVGTSVYSCAGGTVISAGWGGAYGNRIEIQHADGVVTAYNHLSHIITKVGDVVLPGELIAKSGNTGNTTGPHLHLEVTKNGVLENPATWLWGTNR